MCRAGELAVGLGEPRATMAPPVMCARVLSRVVPGSPSVRQIPPFIRAAPSLRKNEAGSVTLWSEARPYASHHGMPAGGRPCEERGLCPSRDRGWTMAPHKRRYVASRSASAKGRRHAGGRGAGASRLRASPYACVPALPMRRAGAPGGRRGGHCHRGARRAGHGLPAHGDRATHAALGPFGPRRAPQWREPRHAQAPLGDVKIGGLGNGPSPFPLRHTCRSAPL